MGIVTCSIMRGYEVLRRMTSCGKTLLFYISYYHTRFFKRRLSHSQRFWHLSDRPLGLACKFSVIY